MRKRKDPQKPCCWKVDGEWWCAVKTRRSLQGYLLPLGHGMNPAEALAHWKRLKAAKEIQEAQA